MRRRTMLIATSSLTATLTRPRAARAATRILRFGAPFPTGSSLHQGMVRFKDHVETATNHELQIDLYPDSRLGDITGLLTRLGDGSIDLALLGIGTAADVPGGSALNLGFLPYLFKDRQWVVKICNGPIFHKLFDDFAVASGIRIYAAYGERLPRAYQTIRGPVVRPADLQGMRIRVAPINVFMEATKALGAIPVPTDIDATYQAFVKGEIDGQENGIELALPLKLWQVAKYFTEVDYAPSMATWYSTEPVWKSFSAEQRAILLAGAEAGGRVITELSKGFSTAGMEKLRQEGVVISQADNAAFRERLQNLGELYEGRAWPKGLVAEIHRLQT